MIQARTLKEVTPKPGRYTSREDLLSLKSSMAVSVFIGARAHRRHSYSILGSRGFIVPLFFIYSLTSCGVSSCRGRSGGRARASKILLFHHPQRSSFHPSARERFLAVDQSKVRASERLIYISRYSPHKLDGQRRFSPRAPCNYYMLSLSGECLKAVKRHARPGS